MSETVSVSMDRTWDVGGHVPLGEVREFEPSHPHGKGWGVGVRHHEQMTMSGRRQTTLFVGASFELSETVEVEDESKTYVEALENFGVPANLIERAVRAYAEQLTVVYDERGDLTPEQWDEIKPILRKP